MKSKLILKRCLMKYDWRLYINALEYFNFGESLIKWVKVMYSNPRCKIVNNGYISECYLSRGVKQGCPLSAYLFIMAIEILAIQIRYNNNIKGLEIQGLKTKVSLYTDDLCFLLNPQFGSLHSLIEDLDVSWVLRSSKGFTAAPSRAS